MSIHVVTAQGEGWIMPKYAAALVNNIEGTTHSHKPNPNAKVNIFLPYYNFPGRDYRGISVCYFTHYEEHPDFTHRRQQWQRAARFANLRISMSQKYADRLIQNFQPTIAIPLPVLFSQVGKLSPKKYRIGISTRHYPTDRKGRDLVAQLRRDKELSPYIELVETNGQVPRDKMAEWYKSLDFYLCTSTIEGGPLGVLEAEICNVPTIVPAGVGWCNEFGRISYQVGTYMSLRGVLSERVIPKQSLTDHNEAAWATKIKVAVGRWL